MALHHIIYLSTPTHAYSQTELGDLLAECQANNAKRQLTGILFYAPQQLLQVLEGEAAVVQATYQRIEADPRHRNLLKLADKPIATRAFPDWSMALHELPASWPIRTGLRDLALLEVTALALNATDTMLLQLVQQQLLTH